MAEGCAGLMWHSVFDLVRFITASPPAAKPPTALGAPLDFSTVHLCKLIYVDDEDIAHHMKLHFREGSYHPCDDSVLPLSESASIR